MWRKIRHRDADTGTIPLERYQESGELIVPTLKKRKMWLKQEGQEIREIFDMGKTPTLEQFKAFLSGNTNAELWEDCKRTPGQCRTIMRQTQRN